MDNISNEIQNYCDGYFLLSTVLYNYQMSNLVSSLNNISLILFRLDEAAIINSDDDSIYENALIITSFSNILDNEDNINFQNSLKKYASFFSKFNISIPYIYNDETYYSYFLANINIVLDNLRGNRDNHNSIKGEIDANDINSIKYNMHIVKFSNGTFSIEYSTNLLISSVILRYYDKDGNTVQPLKYIIDNPKENRNIDRYKRIDKEILKVNTYHILLIYDANKISSINNMVGVMNSIYYLNNNYNISVV